MKTTQSPAALPISQTDALLGAIETGFFEITVERFVINEASFRVAGEPLKVDIFRSVGASTELLISAGREILFSVGQKLPRLSANKSSRQFSAVFSKKVFVELLSQPKCIGIRFFPHQRSSPMGRLISTIVVTGVLDRGFDIEDGPGYFLGN